MVTRPNKIRWAFAASMVLLGTGCAVISGCVAAQSREGVYQLADQHVLAGRFDRAADAIADSRGTAYAYQDDVLYNLDVGMLHRLSGDYRASNQALKRAEDGIERNYTRSASRAGASLILNDSTLVYAGEDYEDVYLNVFMGLNYLAMARPEDAFVEVRRIGNKLALLGDHYARYVRAFNEEVPDRRMRRRAPTNQFQESALARYMSLLFYRNDGSFDDARIDLRHLRDAWRRQPQMYDFPQPRLPGCLDPPARGRARLSIFAFTGRCPEKRRYTLNVFSVAGGVVISRDGPGQRGGTPETVVLPWKDMEPGYHVKFEVPRLVMRGSRVAAVRATVDGKAGVVLEQIESLENACRETFRARESMIVARTAIRVVLKAIAAKQARDEIREEVSGDLGDLLGSLATTTVMAGEQADCRISRYFPACAHVGEIDVTPGQHSLRLEYLDAAGRVLNVDEVGTAEVREGYLNVEESTCVL